MKKSIIIILLICFQAVFCVNINSNAAGQNFNLLQTETEDLADDVDDFAEILSGISDLYSLIKGIKFGRLYSLIISNRSNKDLVYRDMEIESGKEVDDQKSKDLKVGQTIKAGESKQVIVVQNIMAGSASSYHTFSIGTSRDAFVIYPKVPQSGRSSLGLGNIASVWKNSYYQGSAKAGKNEIWNQSWSGQSEVFNVKKSDQDSFVEVEVNGIMVAGWIGRKEDENTPVIKIVVYNKGWHRDPPCFRPPGAPQGVRVCPCRYNTVAECEFYPKGAQYRNGKLVYYIESRQA